MSLRRPILVALAVLPLAGCDLVLLSPSGDVAQQQSNILIFATLLMLLVIVPVMALTVLFAFRYRASNREARYEPDWDHSTQIELVVWAVPLLIIIVLGAVTYVGTHHLDPYRPLGRVDSDTPISDDVEPLEVQAVSLDWKWLFILPQYDVAVVNELALPVDRPVTFSLTSEKVMNTFSVPTMAGMIYTMAGMETTLHGVLNAEGTFEGRSAHYSGAGFSQMRFDVIGTDDAGFEEWIAGLRDGGERLDRDTYLELAEPSVANPVSGYGGVEENLFDLVVNMCVEPGRMCMSEMMAIDAEGGLGLEGLVATLPETSDRRVGAVFGPAPQYVAAICTEEEAMEAIAKREALPVRDRFATLSGKALPHGGQLTPVALPMTDASGQESEL
ncbi:cytochrome o ubiquinol oxidase subunit 2 [Palleronia aestuarii]|uniref:Ubiquinol oxidase polypeptide II n=1 Tax=Palleronia aestuarii TaxID=568105 RepID=A0A2W7NCI5_9RHOB|nr:ubiquinol oxidase subunit II [Palleronia aestuarii]PZX14454.1 cytochrome o ubiquinol oxidase subunit 2 [Palleronia aestuarii]